MPTARTSPHRWRLARIVFAKEMVDHLRDWRSLLLALIYPVLGPALVGILLSLSSGAATDTPHEPLIRLVVAGAEHDPGLADFLSNQGVRLVRVADETPDTLAAEVRARRVPLALVIPPEAALTQTYTTQILFNGGRTSTRLAAATVSELVHAYGRLQGEAAIDGAGLDPAILQPVAVDKRDLGTAPHAATILYGIMGPLTVFIIFLGSVYVSIDSIAGERERGSLEPLLTTPVERWVLLAGKAGCALAFTALSTAVSLAGFKIIAELAVSATDPAPPDALVFLSLLALALPLMLLAVMLQILIAVLSRSMKEAQIYLGLLPLIPAMPGVALVFIPIDVGLWGAAMPILGHLTIFTQLIDGQPIAPLTIGIALSTTSMTAMLLFAIAARLFQREAAFHPA